MLLRKLIEVTYRDMFAYKLKLITMKTTRFSPKGLIKASAIMTLFFTFFMHAPALASDNTSDAVRTGNTSQTVSPSLPAVASLSAELRGCAGTANLAAYPLGCYVYFSDISSITSGTPCLYSIDFGDGTSASGTNPWFTHDYSQGGTYTITYVVQICADNGSTCSDDVTITVYVPCYE
jgi:PKD domain